MRKLETFMERRKELLKKKTTLEGKVLERERERVNSQKKELWSEEEKAENAGEKSDSDGLGL